MATADRASIPWQDVARSLFMVSAGMGALIFLAAPAWNYFSFLGYIAEVRWSFVFVVVTAVCSLLRLAALIRPVLRVNGLVAGLYLLMLATTGLQLFWFRDIQAAGALTLFTARRH